MPLILQSRIYRVDPLGGTALTLRGTVRKRRPSRRAAYRATLAYFETKFEADPNSGCWLWAYSTDSSGYGCHFLHGRVIGAHRSAWEFYRGTIPDGLHVLHRCDTPACVNPAHLFLGSHDANMKDRARKRRHTLQGSPTKITAGDAAEIRASTEATSILARRYGIGRVQVRNIQRGISWKNIGGEKCP